MSARDGRMGPRVDGIDWAQVALDLDDVGVALAAPVLESGECAGLIECYDDDARYRSTIDMERSRFGKGHYGYFDYPLPPIVADLRAAFWPHLVALARGWADRRGQPSPWPDDLTEWLERCHAAGQERPTPLILRYGPGDWNALHRDLYGDLVFPLQVVIALNLPGVDFTGGEFVVVEQRPRSQSRATVTEIPQGHALIFTTRDRPARSARGWTDAPMRHGLSSVRSGRRHALGLVFHDAT